MLPKIAQLALVR